MRYGVSTKMVQMLQSIYRSVKSCVRVHGSSTNFFDSHTGVKQGEPLSPLLFTLFLNDMYTSMYDEMADMVSLDELKMLLLMFADDTVLFLLFCRRSSVFAY